jgi:uncharacterized protein (DUF2267 family)
MIDTSAALVAEVQRKTGLATAGEALHVLEAVVDALGEVLTEDEAAAVAASLPDPLAELIRGGPRRGLPEAGVEWVVRGVSWRENIRREQAMEDVIVVCDVLAKALPADVAAKLSADLPQELATLICRKPEPGVSRRAEQAAPPPERTTLAEGRPGSRHPISEARPERAHSESVARSDDPHGDTKLSGAIGMTQERVHETLAEGEGRSKRTIAR